MYKKLVIICVLFSSSMCFGQFNTVLPKKEILKTNPEMANSQSRLRAEEEELPIINDSFRNVRKELWRQRKFLSLPIDSIQITSEFGGRMHPIAKKQALHSGIDLRANNDYVYSVMPGKVVKTGKNKLLGNYVEVKHGDYSSIYGHLQNVLVDIKQAVEAGQPIAISGNSGRSTGEHLHFGFKHLGKSVDPKPVLDYIQNVIRSVKDEIVPQIEEEVKKMGVKK